MVAVSLTPPPASATSDVSGTTSPSRISQVCERILSTSSSMSSETLIYHLPQIRSTTIHDANTLLDPCTTGSYLSRSKTYAAASHGTTLAASKTLAALSH